MPLLNIAFISFVISKDHVSSVTSAFYSGGLTARKQVWNPHSFLPCDACCLTPGLCENLSPASPDVLLHSVSERTTKFRFMSLPGSKLPTPPPSTPLLDGFYVTNSNFMVLAFKARWENKSGPVSLSDLFFWCHLPWLPRPCCGPLS